MVRPVWSRPLTGRGSEISFLDNSRREVARIPGPEYLDPISSQIVSRELNASYLIPQIGEIREIRAHLGTLYWNVDTDCGKRRFAMKDPTENVIRISEDRLILRDCAGARYEIASVSALDRESRRRIRLVI